MEDDAVVIRRFLLLARPGMLPFLGPLSETDEVGDGIWRFLVKEADGERPSVVSNLA